jgi:uncharacterized protein (TIGR00730 family)
MKITISLTSSTKVGEEYLELTKAVARELAERGHAIVFGGTSYGMMKVLAESYKDAGGKELIGVMAEDLMKVTKGYVAYEGLDEKHIMPTMEARKKKMADLADAFLILPGGYGTLEEVGSYLGGNVNKLYSKPFAFYNHKGFYDSFVGFLGEISDKKFSKVAPGEVSIKSDNLNEILEYFENFKEIEVEDKFVD